MDHSRLTQRTPQPTTPHIVSEGGGSDRERRGPEKFVQHSRRFHLSGRLSVGKVWPDAGAIPTRTLASQRNTAHTCFTLPHGQLPNR